MGRFTKGGKFCLSAKPNRRRGKSFRKDRSKVEISSSSHDNVIAVEEKINNTVKRTMKIITCVAPVNIAVIKYWGKRDEDLIIPLNDSISSTLSINHMCAKTTVMTSRNFKENKFWLNGKEEPFNTTRLTNCLKEVKKQAVPQIPDILNWKIHICSENNFPTAAGLASSAAGYACLIYALASLYEVKGNISAIARQGSGSACRSVFGGWVQWHSGSLKNGTDSIATQIVPANYWPEIRILVLVVNDTRKKHSSTSAMKCSVATSTLLKYRTEQVVPQRVNGMIKAIKEKDFETFANITMQDSNQFHAVCLDTFPPCVYMNDVSHTIVNLIHAYNNIKGTTRAAYTFDAGPNACLYMLGQDVPEIMALINYFLPCDPQCENDYFKGIPISKHELSKEIIDLMNFSKHDVGTLKYVIHTKVGDGPKILEDNKHLLNDEGLPKTFI